MAVTPEVEERIRAVLQAKYAHDQRWDFFGYLVVRGLMSPGCAACRACADIGARELSFLLHEHINDAEVVVRLIASNGFCRRHCAVARDHVTRNYEDELKIVLLYDHLVRSLQRRLGEQPEEIEPIGPRQGCPICVVERDAEAQIVDWIRDGLAVPEIADLYTGSSGLCLRHLFQSSARDWRLEVPVRAVLDATRSWLSPGRSVPGPVGERLALCWGGGWNGDQIGADRQSDCPVCQETIAAERRSLRTIADGTTVAHVPCRDHTRALRSVLEGRDWPRDVATLMVKGIDACLASITRDRPFALHRLRPLRVGSYRATPRDVSRSECPVCRAVDAAAAAALSEVVASELGEHGCLSHIAALGRCRPAWRRALNVALRSRLEGLVARVHEACQFDRVPREARRAELTELARNLTEMFLPPRDGGTTGSERRIGTV